MIGDTLVVTNMAKCSRKKEWHGLEDILHQLDTPVFHVPEPFIIEGGDVVLHIDVIYVGISERTSQDAADYLAQKFPQ